MGVTYKPRPEVLQDFIKALFRADPMDQRSAVKSEYDSEAISILARFNERAVQCCEDPNQALEIATTVVQETFSFWFNHPIQDEEKAVLLTKELLAIYVASYPAEQAPGKGVSSADEERVGDGSGGVSGVTPGETSP